MATESSKNLSEDKASLEESLKEADFPREDETEDTIVLKHVELIERVRVLDENLVDAVKLGFDRAMA